MRRGREERREEGEEEYLMKGQEGANRRLSPQGGGVWRQLCVSEAYVLGEVSLP